jgi:hypothetical protein
MNDDDHPWYDPDSERKRESTNLGTPDTSVTASKMGDEEIRQHFTRSLLAVNASINNAVIAHNHLGAPANAVLPHVWTRMVLEAVMEGFEKGRLTIEVDEEMNVRVDGARRATPATPDERPDGSAWSYGLQRGR